MRIRGFMQGFIFHILQHFHWTMVGQLSIIPNLVQKRENAERKTYALMLSKWMGKCMGKYKVNHKQSRTMSLNASLVVLLLTLENIYTAFGSLLRSVYCVSLKTIMHCNCFSPSYYSLPYFVQNIGEFGSKNILQTIKQLIQCSYLLL